MISLKNTITFSVTLNQNNVLVEFFNIVATSTSICTNGIKIDNKKTLSENIINYINNLDFYNNKNKKLNWQSENTIICKYPYQTKKYVNEYVYITNYLKCFNDLNLIKKNLLPNCIVEFNISFVNNVIEVTDLNYTIKLNI